MQQPKPFPLQFWRSPAGNEPTRDWFTTLPLEDRKRLGSDLRRLQFGWPVGMPLARHIGKGVWELRSTLPTRREARVLFAVQFDRIAILNGFIKKSQKAPKSEVELAIKRLKEMLE